MRRKLSWLLLCAVVVAGGLVQAFPGSENKGGHRFAASPAYHQITRQVFYYVSKKYVDPERAQPRPMLQGAFRELETQFPEVLIRSPEGSDRAVVRVDEVEQTFDLQPAETFAAAAEVLNQVLEFVADQLGQEVERKDVYYFALNGALDSLDPHSNVFSPKHYKEFMIGTRGSFGGIGFVFGIRDGEMTIITPIDGTPAARGGLRSGDRILYIDGEPTINMAVDIAASKMRGEPGTQVTLTLARESWPEPRAITFTREIIHVESVESYVLGTDGQPPVLYAKIKNFQKDTTAQLQDALAAAQEQGQPLAGIILDLRNNPGGLLEQAIALSDGFMQSGTIVSTRGPEPDANSRSAAQDDEPISTLPVIVLINQGSASASEIVSGALKSSRALLVGQKSFGKGSVQKLFPLTEGGALKLTVAKYLTPGDISIQSIGIQPDIAVYPAQIEAGRVRLGPPPEHVQEADLDNAFNEWGNSSGQPVAEVQYHLPGRDEEGEEDARSFAELPREERLERIAEDFEVRLARRIFSALDAQVETSGQREALLRAGHRVLDTVRAEEREKIRAQLSALGVEWGAPVAAGAAELSLQPVAEVQLRGGETAQVTLQVKNVGDAAAYGVWGRTESDNPILNNLDFVFGTLQPGEVRAWTAEVEVPKAARDRWDTFALQLRAAGAEDAGRGEGAVRTHAVAKPLFAYRYEMSDENVAEAKRSGDGVLEVGERVRLSLRVLNRGGAASAKVEANIRADEKEELYLEQARHRAEGLESGGETLAPMAFRLVQASENGEVIVGVTISDRDYGVFLGDSLTFHVGQPYPASEARVPPDFEFAKPLPLRTEADRITVQLVAVDDEAVADVYAYLDDEKIYYARNREGAGRFPITLEVPLAPGANQLVLAVRDQKDLRTTRSLHIFRDGVEAARAAVE